MPEHQPGTDREAVERGDIRPRPVLAVAGVILLALVLVPAACWGLLKLWQVPLGTGPNQPLDFSVQSPRLQSAPQDEKEAYLAEKEELLHGYAWVDREAGIARVPIEVAMDLLAARPGRGGRP